MCDDVCDVCDLCDESGNVRVDLTLNARWRSVSNEICVSGNVCLSCLGKLRIMLLPMMIGGKMGGE